MDDKLVVLAKNRAEMLEAQTQSVGWAWQKLQHTKAMLIEAETNLAEAKKNGWKMSGWQKTRRRELKRLQYYEKVHAALSAGLVIIPNFPIDVFAIRTNRRYPVHQYATNDREWGDGVNRTQRGDDLPIGEGQYFDSEPVVLRKQLTDGEGKKLYKRWADSYNPVDFPIKAVKPAILEETSKALLLKIFDEVGCTPGRPGFNPGTGLRRKGDPMVVGRIIYKTDGWSENRTVSFLITWWLDFKDITV